MVAKFTRHDEEMLEIFKDPAKWAKHHLGEAPRWYQEEILRHPHHRKVLRCGRRIGKTWTMTAHMLWVAFTCNGGAAVQKGATCIVATPYDSQAREIFDQLKNFIDNNPVLRDSIKSMTKNPYLIEFKNKSRIKLFTAGTRSGAEGGSLRGQKADWIYFDEMDYLGDKDFEAIFAITLEAPQRIGVMAASTPTGKRSMFYKICTELKFNQEEDVQPDQNHKYPDAKYNRQTASGWKEFHFPTMVNPEWDDSMEQELRGMYSQVAYEHEVLAEFGTEMVGVFNKDFIDEASSEHYPYTNRRMSYAPIIIGADFDKYSNASQIVVVQYDTHDKRRPDPNYPEANGRFKVIERVEIPRSEYTLDNAVKKIIELNQLYDPDFIYPDRGGLGEYVVETIRKAVGEKVKGIHLGSSHDVRDPISRVMERKPIKSFMVNQASLLLERGMLRIPHKDMDEVLAKQMTDYQVVKVSAKTGEPTYTSENEHALDAMMLALLGFVIEMPELTQTIYQIEAAKAMGLARLRFVDPLANIAMGGQPMKQDLPDYIKNWDEPTPPPPRKVATGWSKQKGNNFTWGHRGSTKNTYPTRKGW